MKDNPTDISPGTRKFYVVFNRLLICLYIFKFFNDKFSLSSAMYIQKTEFIPQFRCYILFEIRVGTTYMWRANITCVWIWYRSYSAMYRKDRFQLKGCNAFFNTRSLMFRFLRNCQTEAEEIGNPKVTKAFRETTERTVNT